MENQQSRIVIVGGGLSGLTAANQILKASSNLSVIVIEAMNEVGGKTQTVKLEGCNFDDGAAFIGPSQKHVIQLARESKNQLQNVESEGKKIIEFQKVISNYTSDYPNNINFLSQLELNRTIARINQMAKEVPSLNPRDCKLGYYWDSMTLNSWLEQNVWSEKVKLLIQGCIRPVLGVQLCEISFLFFLWTVNQNIDFENIISTTNGLQEKRTKLGTQHMSLYLAEQIRKKNGIIRLNFYVKQIQQDDRGCKIVGQNGQIITSDYLVIAMSPFIANKISFKPELSIQRRSMLQRCFMGNLAKVILLYKKQYWKQKGFTGQSLSDCIDSPVVNSYDDSRINQKGQLQPALIVFLTGSLYRHWKGQQSLIDKITSKLAQYYDEQQMKNPVKVHWKSWDDQRSIGGCPAGCFPPGVLSQVDNLRAPQGKIHWAGTEMASVSIGYMDGAIESGKRVAIQLIERLNDKQPLSTSHSKKQMKRLGYTKYIQRKRHFFGSL